MRTRDKKRKVREDGQLVWQPAMGPADIISSQPFWPDVESQQANAIAYQMLDKGYKVYTRIGVAGLNGSSTKLWWILLNPLLKGYDKFNRIGQRIRMKQLVGGGGSLFILYDRNTNGTTPTCYRITTAGDVSTLFDVDSVDGTLTSTTLFPWNSDAFARFIFLNTGTGTLGQEANCTDLHNLPTIYNTGNAGDVTDIVSGALWAVFPQAASAPTANWRLIFEDDYD